MMSAANEFNPAIHFVAAGIFGFLIRRHTTTTKLGKFIFPVLSGIAASIFALNFFGSISPYTTTSEKAIWLGFAACIGGWLQKSTTLNTHKFIKYGAASLSALIFLSFLGLYFVFASASPLIGAISKTTSQGEICQVSDTGFLYAAKHTTRTIKPVAAGLGIKTSERSVTCDDSCGELTFKLCPN